MGEAKKRKVRQAAINTDGNPIYEGACAAVAEYLGTSIENAKHDCAIHVGPPGTDLEITQSEVDANPERVHALVWHDKGQYQLVGGMRAGDAPGMTAAKIGEPVNVCVLDVIDDGDEPESELTKETIAEARKRYAEGTGEICGCCGSVFADREVPRAFAIFTNRGAGVVRSTGLCPECARPQDRWERVAASIKAQSGGNMMTLDDVKQAGARLIPLTAFHGEGGNA